MRLGSHLNSLDNTVEVVKIVLGDRALLANYLDWIVLNTTMKTLENWSEQDT